MCNPIAIMALAAGTQAYGQRQTAKATDRAMENGAVRQGQLQGDINNVVNQGATRDFEIGNMTNSYDKAANDRTATLLDAVQGGNEGNASQQPSSNDDFIQAQAAAKSKQMEAIAKLAGLMGKAGAMGDSGQTRQVAMMGDADKVSGIGQDMRRAQQQTQWDLEKASHKGDNAQLLGSALMFGGSMGLGGNPLSALFAPKAASTAQLMKAGQGGVGSMFGSIA